MRWVGTFSLRSLLFAIGAIGAIAEAIDIAQRADIQVTPAHLIAAGCVALAAYVAKWPSDSTKSEVKEIEARARRESILPPIDGDAQRYIDGQLRSAPRELIDVPGGSHTLVPRAPRVPKGKP
jgi:hypothetical protein